MTPRRSPTVIEALVGGIQATDQAVRAVAAGIIGGVTVVEPVGHDEVEPLTSEILAQRHLASSSSVALGSDDVTTVAASVGACVVISAQRSADADGREPAPGCRTRLDTSVP